MTTFTKKVWGYFETFIECKFFWVKKLTFNNGEGTTLQSHKNRVEIWFTKNDKLRDKLSIFIDKRGSVIGLGKYSMYYLPIGCVHKTWGRGILYEIGLGRPIEKDKDVYREEDYGIKTI